MINYDTILSNYEDKLTLMQWLNKVEEALKDATATGFHVNKTGNATFTFSIDFDDGTTLTSEEVVVNQGESVASAAINNGVLELTLTNGDVLSAGNIFNGNLSLNGDLSVSGDLSAGGDLIVTGNATITGAASANSFTAPSVKATGTGLETDVIKNINGDIDVFANEVDFNGNIQAQGDIETLGDIKTDYLNSDSAEISAKKPIVEDMTGYSFAAGSDSRVVVNYAGVVKNGNKLTFVIAGNIGDPNNAIAANTDIQLGTFVIPSAIGALLYPMSGNFLDMRDGVIANSINSRVGIWYYTFKLDNTYQRMQIVFPTEIAASNVRGFRYEVTFMLSANLAA